jgi:hypothetical protein
VRALEAIIAAPVATHTRAHAESGRAALGILDG